MEEEVEEGGIEEKESKEDGEIDRHLSDVEDGEIVEEDEEDIDFKPTEKVDLEEDLIDLKDIEFLDEELEEISEEIEVSEGEKVFDITDQISDLMDDLLASVPSSKRTPKYLIYITMLVQDIKN